MESAECAKCYHVAITLILELTLLGPDHSRARGTEREGTTGEDLVEIQLEFVMHDGWSPAGRVRELYLLTLVMGRYETRK